MTRSGAQHTQKLRAMDAAVLNLLPHHAFTVGGVRVSRDQETRQRKNQDGAKYAPAARVMPTVEHGRPPWSIVSQAARLQFRVGGVEGPSSRCPCHPVRKLRFERPLLLADFVHLGVQ